ncbi:MAG: AI-2E family transporter, partial [Prolixibacteraceae bacterium]
GELIGIVVVFSLAQFFESYVLEPFVVGGKVDLNPVIVIVGVVLGGIVWGLMGMLLSIPILGILQVIFNNTKSLRPLGYVLDERDVSSGNGKGKKIKEWFMRKIEKMKK